MNKLITVLLVCAAAATPPHAAADGLPVAATVRADGTTNVWTEADLVSALGLVNRKYWRDMQSESGRRAWHGGCTTSIDTNRLIRVWRYEDGFEWTNQWTRQRSVVETEIERAARRARQLATRTNGAPASVAAIMAARYAAETSPTQAVTVVIAPQAGPSPRPDTSSANP